MKQKAVFVARLTLMCIALLSVCSVIAGSIPIDVTIIGGLSMCAPFILAIPAGLKSKMTDEEIEGFKAMETSINDALENLKKGLSTQEDVKKTCGDEIKAYLDKYNFDEAEFKTLKETLLQQGIDIKALKDAGGSGERAKSQEEQLMDYLKSQEFRDVAKCRTMGRTAEIEIKDATPLSAYVEQAGTVTGLIPAFPIAPELFRLEVDRTIHEAPREQNIFWQLFVKGRTNSAMVIWFNRINRQGTALFLPEYGVKKIMSWTYERQTAEPYKIAVMVKISEEMWEDAEFIRGEIRTVLNEEMQDRINESLLTGAGTTLEPNGIANWATPYAGTGLDGTIEMANNADAIRAAVLQMRNSNFTPNVLVLSPTAKAQLDLTKDANGNYLKQDLDAILKPLRIVESTKIEDDEFLLVDTRVFTVKLKGSIKFTTGWGVNPIDEGTEGKAYASDFEMNCFTILLEQRFFAYHNTIDELGAIYDTFTNVKEALQK